MSYGRISIDRPIALVGMMGAGKSTVARRLAALLDVPLIDTDQEIEREAGLSISDLFDRFGETHFRGLERTLLTTLDLSGGLVLATGGGMFADRELRDLLLSRCHTVWLDCLVERLAERAGESRERPLLRGSDPLESLHRIAERRLSTYALSHVRIESSHLGPDEVALQVVRAVKARTQ